MTCSKKPHPIWPNGLEDMPLWNSKILENDLIITCQPHMRNECSWTFWKWENKIFNFHVGQKFIWSLYDDVSLRSRSFHFWQLKLQVQFLFLEIFWLASNSSMILFAMIYEAYWDMNKLSQTKSIHQNHKINHSWPTLTFLGFWTDWTSSDEFQTLIPWELDFKWCPKIYELLIIDHGAQILQEWPPSMA